MSGTPDVSSGAMSAMSEASWSVSAIFVYEENICVTPTTSMMPRSLTPRRRSSARWKRVPNVERVVSDTAKASASLWRRVSRRSVNARLTAPQRSARYAGSRATTRSGAGTSPPA